MFFLKKTVNNRLRKKNLILLSTYKNAHSKIRVKCKKCKKKYSIRAQQAWDRGCKFCNIKKLYETLEKKVYSKRRITNKEFKKLLNKNLTFCSRTFVYAA